MSTPLLKRSTFVVEQIRKFFEMRNQYRIFDEEGTQIGSIEQVKQSALALLARFGTDLDVALPTWLDVNDSDGRAVLHLHKPWFRMTFGVSGADGTELGSISKRIRLGKARFTLSDSQGTEIGEIRAENWRARDFSVSDQTGTEVARTTKKWRGLATEMFTDADTYVVSIEPYASDPIRSLALAGCLAIDVIMKEQD